jgi:uncharacterized damage-inducible protein DinB
MTRSPQQRQRLLNDLDRHWQELLNTIDRLDIETIHGGSMAGQWSIKDIMGHIMAWERIALERIALAETGERRRLVKSVHGFNREQAAALRDTPLDDLRREMEETHRELVAKVSSSPVVTRDLIRADTFDHYRDHLGDIAAGLEQRNLAGTQPSTTDPRPSPSPGR